MLKKKQKKLEQKNVTKILKIDIWKKKNKRIYNQKNENKGKI